MLIALALASSRCTLKTIQFRESAFFSQKVAHVRLKFGQNQGLWRQNGVKKSPGLGGVF